VSDELIEVTIDDRVVRVPRHTTIFDAAQQLGITIPTVCHLPPQAPAGVCRVCCVDVWIERDGKLARERVMSAACARKLEPAPGTHIHVKTNTEEVQQARRTLIELLMADHPSPCAREQETKDCELEAKARELRARPQRFQPGPPKRPPIAAWATHDDSHPNIAVDHAACIVCDRCVRACTDIAHNYVIGRAGKGNATVITFDAGQLMGASTCVSCGECMVSCPTGALTNKGFGDATIAGEPVGAEALLSLRTPDGGFLFEGIAPRFLQKVLSPIGRNERAVVRRRVRKGEVLCREGDFGSTAFYILDGEVDVRITTPQSRVHNLPGALGRFAVRMKSILGSEGDDETQATSIPIDASVDLSRAEPVAKLGPGELFGEMTCLNFYPRSATVTATRDTVVLEMLRPVLQLLKRSKHFAAWLDASYRGRTIETHLRGVWCLQGLSEASIHYLRDRVTLQRFEPGQVISEQGSVADAFYLVRLGFVKIVTRLPGGEVVRAYQGRGAFFGEMGLLLDKPRNATCIAVDHVDVVRVAAADFWEMLELSPPGVKDQLLREAQRRDAENALGTASANNVELEDFLQQGLMEAQSLLVLDLDRCTRCDLCVQACATAHDGVTRLIREGLRYDHYLVATSCRQCRDPLCMVGCPVGSIRRRNELEIHIENWCIGCGVCADNCPYGNITMHEFEVKIDDPERPGRRKAVMREKATACDLCKNLAPDQDPSCVVACPHGAAVRVANPKEFFATALGTTGEHGAD